MTTNPTYQQRLFDEPAPWELDDVEQLLVATVVFPSGPHQEFDYRVPESLRGSIEVGRRVRVPLGRGDRIVQGYCVALETRPAGARHLKDVRKVVDAHTLLTPAMIRLTRWLADHYLCDWGQVLETVIPAPVREGAGTRLTTLLSVPTSVAARLSRLELPKKQAEILRCLAASAEPLTPKQLAERARSTQGPITALRRKGLISAEVRRLDPRAKPLPPAEPQPDHELNPDQQLAFDTIVSALRAGRHETVLLYGITGSGKTEVYIRAIQEVVGYGRQAIVLVPEISLTPQTVERFRGRFGDVAVLHSHLSDAERHWHWQRIARGQVSVVVGARSAVFAPVPRLGLVVLDEEHESTFKQETVPRYHAREVALFRARDAEAPLVLGSATPALESWYRASRGEYKLVELPGRVLGRPLPDVVRVDLRAESRDHVFRGAISRQLEGAMKSALREGGQVILLLNRRGYSTHIQCPGCGEAIRCTRCDIAMTHHRHLNRLICHYCDENIPPPRNCPKCGTPEIRYGGFGTQRLEAEVKARFPEFPCLRMDTDAMQSPGSHERSLAAFRRGEVRILLGTQMIAKGLDFPNVTVVGVINADTALHLPDFRAAERTFQLVVQVAGRTGRGEKGGRVLVQTFAPDHPSIVAAVRHDYATFAGNELSIREAHGYPPFAEMARLVIRGPHEETTAKYAEFLADRVQTAFDSRKVPTARVLGPAPCPIARLRGKLRFQIQAHSPDGPALRAALLEAITDFQTPDDIQWIVDVDPLEML